MKTPAFAFYKHLSLVGCILLIWMHLVAFTACSDDVRVARTAGREPTIYPDYRGVTIPPNIAPLCFKVSDSLTIEKTRALFVVNNQKTEVRSSNNVLAPSLPVWKKLMKEAAGKTVEVTVQARMGGLWISYTPFSLLVAADSIDPYLAYRLIEPGYEVWDDMGLYQRCLENFTETTLINNKRTGNNCVNCHSFCQQNPEKMLFHMRAQHAGTLLIDSNRVEKLNTKTDQTQAALTYPSWHPSGDFVAFSVNETNQAFHTTNRNRIEVFDKSSDVVVYDVKKHELITAPHLFSGAVFETFPTFSADGKTLYFCSAPAQPMPQSYDQLRYSLCSVSFDPESRRFGTRVDTLFHGPKQQKSVSFPRVSPDGRLLLFTLSAYGNFSIWHKEADLCLYDLRNRQMIASDTLNSNETESYHSWSSNSRWVVFSSRRLDGLYTRPFIAYIGANGETGKPFLLPQKDVDFYDRFMKSYNIPEFITGRVKPSSYRLSQHAMQDEGIDVKFGGMR